MLLVKLERSALQFGQSTVPPLVWGNVPASAKEILIIVQDADVPIPRPLTHAIFYGIPASRHSLDEEDIPHSTLQVGGSLKQTGRICCVYVFVGAGHRTNQRGHRDCVCVLCMRMYLPLCMHMREQAIPAFVRGSMQFYICLGARVHALA